MTNFNSIEFAAVRSLGIPAALVGGLQDENE